MPAQGGTRKRRTKAWDMLGERHRLLKFGVRDGYSLLVTSRNDCVEKRQRSSRPSSRGAHRAAMASRRLAPAAFLACPWRGVSKIEIWASAVTVVITRAGRRNAVIKMSGAHSKQHCSLSYSQLAGVMVRDTRIIMKIIRHSTSDAIRYVGAAKCPMAASAPKSAAWRFLRSIMASIARLQQPSLIWHGAIRARRRAHDCSKMRVAVLWRDAQGTSVQRACRRHQNNRGSNKEATTQASF